jgi:N-acetyl-anhydromuramyl-L-alanine amidase AmpD
MIGCHVKGYNRFSIGICYEGGRGLSPRPPFREGALHQETVYEDNRTAEQMVVLHEIFTLLHECYPDARIVGHNELNPHKACPCLSPKASVEYRYIFG